MKEKITQHLGHNNIWNFNDMKKKDKITLSGTLGGFDKPDKNGNVYSKELLDKFNGKQITMELSHKDSEMVRQLLDTPISVASRGYGKIDEDGKINDFQLISYDVVSNPVFKSATMKRLNWFKDCGIKLKRFGKLLLNF